jgi:hypothetical protein
MAEPRVSLDPGNMGPVEAKLRGPLEDQLSSALSAATERVNREYAGQDVDQVYRMLLDGTREGLHPDIAAAFDPDKCQLREIAVAITSRQLG